MVRFLLVCLVVAGFLILTIPVLVFLWLLRFFSKRAADVASLRIVQGVFRLILFISGVRATVIGEENVPKGRSVLYVGNHHSYFDILLTCVRFPGPTGFISKKEMDRYPLLNIWMRRLYCLFLDRADLRQGITVIKTAAAYIKDGISICVFPEGTRNKGDKDLPLLPFHEGSFKIASKSGCPIVPIAISHSQQIFEAHFPRIVPTTVTIEYGPAIYPESLTAEERRRIPKMAEQQIVDMLAKNS